MTSISEKAGFITMAARFIPKWFRPFAALLISNMRLADRIAQCRTPFIVENTKDGSVTHLNGATAFSKDIAGCATRYVLSDELTRLCTALAYSKGASTLACADLLHVPAERVWVEWTEAPWRNELAQLRFQGSCGPGQLWAGGVSSFNPLPKDAAAC